MLPLNSARAIAPSVAMTRMGEKRLTRRILRRRARIVG